MMTEPTPTPSLLLRACAVGAKWALGLLAFAWAMLAIVWGGLHFLIVPRIADFRPMLEQHASTALGLTVQIGDISAMSNGLIPSIELNEVRFLGPQGREVLRLPKVLLALSARSVLGGGLEQLYVEGPVLDMRRAADGRIWIAGFVLPENTQGHSKALDWVFSQPELVVRGGTLNWSDEQRGAPPLVLDAVDVVLRNRLFGHKLRLDATPPAAWGEERLSLMGVFRQSVLSHHPGDWIKWKGQVYADFTQADLGHLRQYLDMGADLTQGVGSVRAWLDVDRGQLLGATADVALKEVSARFGSELAPLSFHWVAGRLGARRLDGGFEVQTRGLEFDTVDSLRWPGGNLRLGWLDATARQPARGELSADRLDLAALAQIGQRLPLGERVREALQRLAPRGLVEQVSAQWSMPGKAAGSTLRYSAKGRVQGLALAAARLDGAEIPGIHGADVDFDLSAAGGNASVALHDGGIDAPDVFDEPAIDLTQLSADVQWKLDGPAVSVQIAKLRFANADAQGEAQIKWHSAPDAAMGVLDLQGSFSRANAARVHRYLPTVLDKEVRSYLRDALLGGKSNAVKFSARGRVDDFPFTDPKQGEFRVSASVQDAVYAFAPASIMPKDALPWPVLTQLSGEVLIERGALYVKAAHGLLGGAQGLQVTKADVQVSNLYGHSALSATLEARSPLADALHLVNSSRLSELTDKVLARASGSGNAEYRLKLAFPVAAVERATVQGAVLLNGNEVQIAPDIPRLSRVRGAVAFSESGFSVNGLQARALGGDVRLDGGLSVHAAPTSLRLQGTATAEGLRQAPELGFVARLADYATGGAGYTAVIGLRSGVPELQVSTTLVGLALDLPAPFAKSTDTPLLLRVDNSLVRGTGGVGVVEPLQDRWLVELGRLASVVYVRDISHAEPQVLRGAIGVGLAADENTVLPATGGVNANVRVDRADLDAWGRVLTNLASPQAAAGMGYVPTSVALRADELLFGGHKLSRVLAGGGREDALWRANVDSSELSGYLEYRQPSGSNAGRVYARLARVALAPSTAQDVENLLDEQPVTIPALDVVIDDFELRGKHLGRLEVEAVNLGLAAAGPQRGAGRDEGRADGGRDAVREGAREWRLNRFNLSTPEAVLTASGNWADISAQPAASVASAARSIKDRRRTALNFKLDISDSGALLNRFGMTNVVRSGRGKLEGQVGWLGSPITLDYPSMSGKFNVNVEEGQFLQADPGLAKLLGVLSLQSLPRRLALDFRDVFSEGFAFDFVRGDVLIQQGIARTDNLQMKGVNAAVLMDGQADLAKETQSVRVVVIPEINAGSASLLASAVNPLIGLTTFLAQAILRQPLMNATTQEFLVDGTWLEPRVTKVTKVNRSSPP